MRTFSVFLILLVSCSEWPVAAPEPIVCDLLIVGGSLGGVAAALAAKGQDVWLISEDDWVGGQVTSQGISALDEHAHIERFGGTELYQAFRAGVRGRSGGVMNPGGGWVSRLCFEPKIGLSVLEELLGDTHVLRRARAVQARVSEDVIREVEVRTQEGATYLFSPRFVLDASDNGDMLPLAEAEYHIGAESQAQTLEPHANVVSNPRCVQSFTFSFAVEYRPGESHVIERPVEFDQFRDRQPFSLDHWYEGRGYVRYGFFERRPGTPGSFFDYRKIGLNLALINWPGNDYRDEPLLEVDLDRAKALSRSFLYWLQTECPRDDGGLGYPELLLRKDVMGSEDGFSRAPYVREGRRLIAKTLIREQDLVTGQARARSFHDSVGVGYYGIDLHACAGDMGDRTGRWIPCAPFQIPLGAMVPVGIKNLLAAGKCLGTTHVTNGAYRLHPVEWAVGEAAARTAAFCIARGLQPAEVLDDLDALQDLQHRLLRAGVPLYWFLDLPKDDPDLWVGAQWGAITGEFSADSESLLFGQNAEHIARARRLGKRDGKE